MIIVGGVRATPSSIRETVVYCTGNGIELPPNIVEVDFNDPTQVKRNYDVGSCYNRFLQELRTRSSLRQRDQ